MKLDLTLDLIGSAPPRLIGDLAREKAIDLSRLFEGDGYDLRHGARAAYDAAASVVTTPRDVARLADAVLGDGYAELRLTPSPGWADLVAGVAEGAAGRLHAVIARLPRHLGPEALRPLTLAAAERGSPLSLTGTTGALKDYDWTLDCAAEAGLPLILDGTDVTRHPRRIRCATLTDAEAERLAEAGIGVELTDWMQAGRLYDRGITLALGRGFAAFEPLNLPDRLHDAFDWDDAVFADLDRKALAVTVCDDTTRDRVKEMTDAP
ncbi:hypothetical protein [Falsirhodobacter sp. 20TX0035]|uniref:hypothetical protein n=1 Tax=Falsirhodobacter sp. 20TX0035 TaxID=3022019 RepID=UPI00232D0E95|nr:hypothetical protein [Falsirhodobacter sp. 20TX0035]MDB6452135.1 hypothetical protein [Falsirhodobacter sp. 20TX0035]